MNNTIRSMCAVPASEMSDRHIDILLNNYSSIPKKLAKDFLRRNEGYDYKEIFGVLQEGMYKAIKASNPKIGKTTSYVYYYCRGYLSAYIKTQSKRPDCDFVRLIDTSAEKDFSEDDLIYMKEILLLLPDRQSNALELYCDNTPLKLALPLLGIKTRKTYHKLVNQAIENARQIDADILVY